MQDRETQILTASDRDLDRAAQILADGGLVSFPTETVYGLGADARQGRAVAGIFAAKDRPSFNPLIVHVASLDQARRHARLDGDALRLAQTFWPGPLTLVVPLIDGHGLSELVTAGLPTVGLRMPDHPVAQKLLKALDGPIAAPSANPSGRISPTTAQHVLAGLDGRIDAVIDAGPCAVGLESTIVGFDGDTPILLRPGGLPAEAIEAALSRPLARWEDGSAINAPGQLSSHYAPDASVRLNAETPAPGELYLGFGDRDGDLNLSPSGDLVEAAARLFACLHMLDGQGKPIAVAPIPDTGLGRAINDRLKRAAAPRTL
ncbi:L-threonylcarbamoyladenylate synthase [Aestuariivita boseongensis]|uniref:L-threonylcarbamoyladenylate synthase n=1 Tax=Aestuariivita boseongensis TaxID=1470562 RepID=UPI0006811B85|nr:L-threonylcarbamoyladenylate synthase [Aestuariivita boseongensis]